MLARTHVRWLSTVLLLFVCGFVTAQKDTKLVRPTAEKAWRLEINAQALHASGLLDRVMYMMEDAEEVRQLTKLYEEVIGLNPWKDIQGLRFEADSIDIKQFEQNPFTAIKGALIEVKLTKPGNLEGLLLATPNYKSEDVSGTRIHSCSVENLSFHVAFKPGPKGGTSVFASMEADTLKKAIAAAASASPSDGEANGSDTQRIARLSISEASFKALRDRVLQELGNKDEPPVAMIRNVAGMLAGISLELNKGQNDAVLKADLEVTSTGQVTQLQQFIRAAIGFAKVIGADEPEVALLAKAMENKTSVKAQGKTVTIEVSLDALMSLLQ